jgi:hypothetical protein
MASVKGLSKLLVFVPIVVRELLKILWSRIGRFWKIGFLGGKGRTH